MTIPTDEQVSSRLVPTQRTAAPHGRAPSRQLPGGTSALVPTARHPARTDSPTPADVALGAMTLAFTATRSAVGLGFLAGQLAVERLPVPSIIRSGGRSAWLSVGRVGRWRRSALQARLSALLDAVVPSVVREVLERLDVARLVDEFVDLDHIATGLDVDRIADRLDLDRAVDRVDLDRAARRLDIGQIIDRIDLDEIAARLDLDRIIDRIDLDRVAERLDIERILARLDLDAIAARLDVEKVVDRVDLDRVVDRVDLDRAAARLDLDPIIDRADIVGLARYIVDAIDLPELIRTSTGSMTSDMVTGVRAQGAEADEAVERVVDRLLRRRGKRDVRAPEGFPR